MYRFKPINVRNDKNEIKKGINKRKKKLKDENN